MAGRSLALLVGVVGFVAGCGDDISIVQIVENPPGSLGIATSCAENVDVSVDESDTVVSLEIVDGEAIDGDCGGSAAATLSGPIGNRKVMVGGDEWRVRSDCEVPVVIPERDLNAPCPSVDR